MTIHNEKVLCCDFCGDTARLPFDFDPRKQPPLPDEWQRATLPGWAGNFHACSDDHAEQLHMKYFHD